MTASKRAHVKLSVGKLRISIVTEGKVGKLKLTVGKFTLRNANL